MDFTFRDFLIVAGVCIVFVLVFFWIFLTLAMWLDPDPLGPRVTLLTVLQFEWQWLMGLFGRIW
jgi:hypothetical protein